MSKIVARILCPFHDDHYPSFMIYEDRTTKCFGCGYKGNVWDLLFALVGAKQALVLLSSGQWTYYLRDLFGARGYTFVPGQRVEWDLSHPAMSGVRVGVETLSEHGCYLVENALALRVPFVSLSRSGSVMQYRLGRGKYVYEPGTRVMDGVGLWPGEGSTCVVEGVLDALRLRELGYEGNLVVLLGSVLSRARTFLLKHLTRPLFAVTDSDDAGRRLAAALVNTLGAVPVELEVEDPQCLDQLPEILEGQGTYRPRPVSYSVSGSRERWRSA